MDISDNVEKLCSPYNEEEPIEGTIDRLNEFADFTAAERDSLCETQPIHITYGLVAETDQYPEYFWAYRTKDNKSWMAL